MKKLLTLSLCTLLLWSCAKDSEVAAPSSATLSVTFTSEITSRVYSSGFEISDTISVAAYDGTKALSTNTLYGYNGYYFDSDTPIQYESSTQELTFTAVYPAQESSSIMSFNFEIAADQSIDDTYEMSDLLVAVSSPTTERQPGLTFDHVMSNIVISVIPSDDCEGAILTLNAQNNATCNLSTQTYTATGNSTTITSIQDVDTKYKSIIAPQEVSANTLFATLTVGDQVYEWTTLEAMTFESGYQYSYIWDLDINNFIPEGIINEWEGTEGEASTDIAYSRLDDYSATSYPSTATTWIIYDVYASTDGCDGLRDALNTISRSEVDTREISLEFPNLVSVPDEALRSTGSSSSNHTNYSTCLVSISLPSAISIGSYAFYPCTSLNNVYLPKVLSVGSTAFSGCSSLLSLTLESIVSVGSSAFKSITNLVSVSLPNAVTIGSSAFSSCSNLISVSLPNAIFLESSAFSSCSQLIDIYIPNVTTINTSTFSGCSSLISLSIPKFTTFSGGSSGSLSTTSSPFYSCSDLMYVTIATESKIVECRTLFNSLTTTNMFLTIGKENEAHVNGNIFSTFNTEGATTAYTFYEITVTE
ncbi:MAG: fimbrillin family protein [Rikenellaceae bacterium]